MTDFNKKVENIINIFTTRKIFSVCLLSSTLLVNHLGEGNVIEGYQIFEREKKYIRHYWVRLHNRDIDIGTEINKRLDLAHAYMSTKLSVDKPDSDYFYASELDLEELSELSKLERLYQLYNTNQKRYWKLVLAYRGWIKKVLK